MQIARFYCRSDDPVRLFPAMPKVAGLTFQCSTDTGRDDCLTMPATLSRDVAEYGFRQYRRPNAAGHSSSVQTGECTFRGCRFDDVEIHGF